ncbi:MAG: M56 family metallopeptidase [Thermoguttaceae bacterium]
MHDTSALAPVALTQLILALAAGTALMVLAALAAESLLARATMRRTLWQAVLLGFSGLLVLQLCGAPQFLAALASTASPDAMLPTGPARVRTETSGILVLPAAIPGSSAPVGPVPAWAAAQSGPENPSLPATPLSDWQPTPASARPTAPSAQRPATASPPPRRPEAAAILPALPDPDMAVDAPVGKTKRHRTLAAMPALAAWCLGLVWIAGTCLAVGRSLAARWRLFRLGRRWTVAGDPKLEPLVDRLRQRLGLKRPPQVRCAAELSAPVAFGVFRPTMLLPADFGRRFSLPQQQVILAHELAHLAARDPAWLLIGDLAVAMFWWHPLAHLARRRLATASELAADEASALVPDGPDVLADCLVQLGRRLGARPRLGLVAAEGTGLRSGLARRVERLLKLDQAAPTFPPRGDFRARAATLLAMILLTIPCTLWAQPSPSFAKGEETMNVLKRSWRQSLAAAALTALLAPAATDLVADDAPAPPKPAQLEQGSPADHVLSADQGDRERREGDARRDPAPDRPRESGEARHDRQPGDREPGDREGDHPASPEAARHDGPIAELRRHGQQLEQQKAELQEQAARAGRELDQAVRKTAEELAAIGRRIAELETQRAQLTKEPKQEGAEGKIAEIARELEKATDVRSELTKRTENLKREMAEHQANVQRRRAELERSFAEFRAQHARAAGEARAPGDAGRPSPELMLRIQELIAKAFELRRAGKNDEAEKIQQELRGLHARLAAPGDPGRPGPREPREGMERAAAMEREIGRLREAGHPDAAERLERELQQMHRPMEGPRDGDRPGPPPELKAKIDHLRMAMENLHAAGLHDQAEQIAQQLERLMREIAPDHRPGPDSRPGPDGRPGEPRRPDGPPPGGPEFVGQLRGEIEQLRRENQELRQMINEMRQAQERFMNEIRERK